MTGSGRADLDGRDRDGGDLDQRDLDAVERELGRRPRAVVAVAHRCPCGQPDVVQTAPRLEDGTPFPTLYYLTCPRAAGLIGTLEADGVMRRMSDRLAADDGLAAGQLRAHEDYLSRREALGEVPEIEGISAGGMPARVKCLHVLAAHALAAGPGVNPLGDEVLAAVPDWWAGGPCAIPSGAAPSGATASGDVPADAGPPAATVR